MSKVRVILTVHVEPKDGKAAITACNAIHRALKQVTNRDREDAGITYFEIESFTEVESVAERLNKVGIR